jgi:hypothetical protein
MNQATERKPVCREHQWGYAEKDYRYCLNCGLRQVQINGEWKNELKPTFRAPDCLVE